MNRCLRAGLAAALALVGCAGSPARSELSPSGDPSRSADPSPLSTPLPVADPAYVVARIHVGAQPCGVVAEPSAVWISTFGSNALHRIDPQTDTVTDVVPVGAAPCGLGYGAGSIWTSDYQGNTVTRVDVKTRKVVATIAVGRAPYDAAFGLGSAWVTNGTDGTVSRIDPATNTVVATIEVGPNPAGVAIVGDSAWVPTGPGVLVRIDGRTNKVRQETQVTESLLTWTSHSEDALWVSAPQEATVYEIDTRSGRVLGQAKAGTKPADGDVLGPDVWVPNRGPGPGAALLRIDRRTRTVTSLTPPLLDGFVVGTGFGDVWVPDFGGTDLLRVRPSLVPTG